MKKNFTGKINFGTGLGLCELGSGENSGNYFDEISFIVYENHFRNITGVPAKLRFSGHETGSENCEIQIPGLKIGPDPNPVPVPPPKSSSSLTYRL